MTTTMDTGADDTGIATRSIGTTITTSDSTYLPTQENLTSIPSSIGFPISLARNSTDLPTQATPANHSCRFLTTPVDAKADAEAFFRTLHLGPDTLPWPPTVLTAASITLVQDILRNRRDRTVRRGHTALTEFLSRFELTPPRYPVSHGPSSHINMEWANTLAAIVDKAGLSPAQLVELVRGQSTLDYRPNKSLFPDDYHDLFHGYYHQDAMIDMARSGFRVPRYGPPHNQNAPPPNHGSARLYNDTLTKLMREGQAHEQYVFLHNRILSKWQHQLFFSPLGLVPKGKEPMSVIARVIQDLSFPLDGSVNDLTNKNILPIVDWPKIVQLAERITHLHRTCQPGTIFKGMTGDVAQAYRNLRVHSEDCALFALSLPQSNVFGLDMSAPFGWHGSPNMYCVFGNGISWLVQKESPASINPTMSCDSRPFWCFNYMDDCIIIEIDEGERLASAAIALQLSMIATFGPEAMNLKKFQPWQESFIALGLQWNLRLATISMPVDKIQKAASRVKAILLRGSASRSDLEKTLGSLRHVTSCIRPARAFYQSLHQVYRRFPKFGYRTLTKAARADLLWFDYILHHAPLTDIPTTIFSNASTPTIRLQMDASNHGIAIIDAFSKRFIQLLFDETELSWISNLQHGGNIHHEHIQPPLDQFTINVREHFAIALAICIWGTILSDPSGLATVHIEVVSDNTAAIAWSITFVSPNLFSQNLNRHIAVACACNRLFVSSAHIPGCLNVLPDAGSRTNDAHHRAFWQRETFGWTPTPIPAHMRYMYRAFSTDTLRLWAPIAGRVTTPPGVSGHSGVPPTTTHSGCPVRQPSTPKSSCAGPKPCLTNDPTPTVHPPSLRKPLGFRGSINAHKGIPSISSGEISPSSPVFSGADLSLAEPKHLCHPGCCLQVAPLSTSPSPMTASYGGLRSWLGFSCGAALNTWLSTAPQPNTP